MGMGIKVLTKGVRHIDVEKLVLDQASPRRGDIDLLKRLFKHNGFYGVVVVQKKTMKVIVGNHRVMAARELGMESIPTTIINVDDTQARNIMLSDNRASDRAVYDNAALFDVLGNAIEDGGLDGTGFDLDVFQTISSEFGSTDDDDFFNDDDDGSLGDDDEPPDEDDPSQSGLHGPSTEQSTSSSGEPPATLRKRIFALTPDEDDAVERVMLDVMASQEMETETEVLIFLVDFYTDHTG